MINLLSAGLGGLLLALAFPPFRFDFLAWVAFVPLFRALHDESSWRRGVLHGAVFGLVFFLIDISWIYRTVTTHGHFPPLLAVATYAGLALYLSAFPACFGAVLAVVGRRGWDCAAVAPFLWTGLEYVRTVAFTGFPWDLVGYSQAERLVLIQIADLTGVYGISFLVLLVNAAAWDVVRSALLRASVPWRPVGVAGLIFAAVVVYGIDRLQRFPAAEAIQEGFPVGVVQGNIPQEVKWEPAYRAYTFATYERIGRSAVEAGARLLVWPETAAPVVYGVPDSDVLVPHEISDRLGVPMLVGAPSARAEAEGFQYYNSALLMDGFRLRQRYAKIHLVPFGEYMPLSWLLPLGPGIAAREADYSAGDAMTVMQVERCPPFSVLICYEAIFPELARMALSSGARFLINITNDGWFGRTAAPEQHLAMALLRSVENRVWLVRAANTGISAAFDPAGRCVRRIELDQEGFFTIRIPDPHTWGSIYSRIGDVFALGCLAACGILVVAVARRAGGRERE